MAEISKDQGSELVYQVYISRNFIYMARIRHRNPRVRLGSYSSKVGLIWYHRSIEYLLGEQDREYILHLFETRYYRLSHDPVGFVSIVVLPEPSGGYTLAVKTQKGHSEALGSWTPQQGLVFASICPQMLRRDKTVLGEFCRQQAAKAPQ
jgi:hypothetical protein